MNHETQILLALSPFIWLTAWWIRAKLRSTHYAGISMQVCPCGSHDKKPGAHITHWWSLPEWIAKLDKIRNRKGKRKTKLSRLRDNLLQVQESYPALLKDEEELQAWRVRVEKAGRAYNKELIRVADRQTGKWMLCRHCSHVSQRSMHTPEVIEYCDFNSTQAKADRRDIANNTFFTVKELVE